MSPAFQIDMTGQTFGELTVVKFDRTHVSPGGQRTPRWLCQCSCGNTKSVAGPNLRNGNTKSCGCKERAPGRSRILSGKPTWLGEMLSVYRRGASDRGFLFDLTVEQFETLVGANCYYCGAAPSERALPERKVGGNYLANGIDRKDSSLGYFFGNCVPCCTTCNVMKMALTAEQFIEHAKRIAAHAR